MFASISRQLTISRAVTAFGALIVTSLAIIVGISIYGIAAVGIGGANYDRVAAGKDLVADILPPPEYIIEAYLEVNLLIGSSNASEVALHRTRLTQLEKDFAERRGYWKASLIPEALKKELTEDAGREADRFWTETNAELIPAVERNDKAAIGRSFDRLKGFYSRHRAVIDDIVIKANAFASDVETDAKAKTPLIMSVIGGVAGFVLVLIVFTLFLIRRKVVKPIVGVARTMSDLAVASLRRETETRAQTNLDANLAALREAVYERGQPRRDQDKLYFGDYVANGDNALVDQIKNRFGGTATIFLGDVRVATNVRRADGERAIGTVLASGPAYDAAIKKATMYRGETQIFDRPYLAVYEPILNGETVIGLIYVGVPKDDLSVQRHSTQASDVRNEVVQMQMAILTLQAATTAKDEAEHEALQQRYQAADALRRASALSECAAADQRLVVGAISTALASLADTDLTHRIDADFPDDYKGLKSDFTAAATILRDTMMTISQQASTIVSVTGEIAQANDDLSRRTEQQAASLEETAAALDEITANVQMTAGGATHARDVVGITKADAERSGQVVRQAVAAMSGIQDSSRKIGQIIGVIDEIAFQTNLLALNAGVEAARAGEAGRGFAVVASEVRALAQRSADAAKEIKTLISTSSLQVEDGVKLVGDTGSALERILVQVAEISSIVLNIAASTSEQATGLSEVNKAINQMDQFTQQNAAMVEQSAAASLSLTREIDELTRLIDRFQIGATSTGALARISPAKPKGRPSAKPTVSNSGGTRLRIASRSN